MNRILIRYMEGMATEATEATEDNETRESIESDAILFAICFENGGGVAETIQFRGCYSLSLSLSLFLFFFFLIRVSPQRVLVRVGWESNLGTVRSQRRNRNLYCSR